MGNTVDKSFAVLAKINELKAKGYIISDQLESYKGNEQKWGKFINGVKYIFVGDNPGDIEKENYTYFSEEGQSGKNIRTFVNNFLGVDFDTKVLALNKSLIYTHSTADLNDEDAGRDESMELVAELIKEIKNENNEAIICIFGIDSLKKTIF